MLHQPRSQFCRNGEASNHDLTYSGVVPRPLRELPRVDWEDKKNVIFGNPLEVSSTYCEKVAKEIGKSGTPLFWGDYKTVDLWSQLFQDYCAHGVGLSRKVPLWCSVGCVLLGGMRLIS